MSMLSHDEVAQRFANFYFHILSTDPSQARFVSLDWREMIENMF
jgi:hypothetical protein